MQLPTLTGLIKRRLLVNFRADVAVVQAMLPRPFRPKLHRGHAIVGVCLIRLEQIRPAGWPGIIGISSENAAHRIAVQWTAAQGLEKEGVYIPRRDTDACLNRLAGGRIFPGEHNPARFVVTDDGERIDLRMKSDDGRIQVTVVGAPGAALPKESCFGSLEETSAYFEGGSLGYSVTSERGRLDGLRLRTKEWKVGLLDVSEVESSFFADERVFPRGTVHFDHALIMRDLPHEWHNEDDLQSEA